MNISKLALIALLGGALMAFGCSSDSNGGGDGGTGGGGNGGNGGEPTPTCDDTGGTPPTLEDACSPLTSANLTNPASCDTMGGEVVTHKMTLLLTERSVDVGFNLDNKNTTDIGTEASCIQGGLSSVDGMNGVDNQVAALQPLLETIDGSLDPLDDALASAICQSPFEGPVQLTIDLAVNAAGNCANATLTVAGDPPAVIGPAPLNFVNGCLSGTIGDFPLAFPTPDGIAEATLNNTSLAVTADQTQGFTGTLSGTIAGEDAVTVATILNPDAGPIVGQTFDILQSLADDPETACDSISLVLEAGGVVDTGAGGAGGNGGAGGDGGAGGAGGNAQQ